MTQEDMQYRDEIIEMARAFEVFAKLVADVAAAKEREACAKVCEKLTPTDSNGVCPVADAIRARGETTLRGEAT